MVLKWISGGPGAGLCPAPGSSERPLSTTLIPHELKYPFLGTLSCAMKKGAKQISMTRGVEAASCLQEAHHSIAVSIANKNIDFSVGRFSIGFRPILASRPLQTGPARKMVQNAPNNSPRDQVQLHLVTFLSHHQHYNLKSGYDNYLDQGKWGVRPPLS